MQLNLQRQTAPRTSGSWRSALPTGTAHCGGSAPSQTGPAPLATKSACGERCPGPCQPAGWQTF